jgi:putative ABC transport system permease protein
MYEKDRAITKLMTALSIIALVIASLGLFALSAYVVELRVKEIGIRKVNGANIINIFSLLSRDFLKWVVYAMVIAMPLAWYLMNYWLQNYAYRTEISWWIFAIAGLLTLLVSWITISYHTSRASLTNPIEVLRNE